MNEAVISQDRKDKDGNPAGGTSYCTGMDIHWQDGPLGRGADRKEPNGAFVEDVLIAAVHRLEFYQESKFASKENASAIAYIKDALRVLNDRTKDREARLVEGTHTV